MINRKEHLTTEGLQKIVAIRATVNRGQLSDKLKAAFPNVVPVNRPLIYLHQIIHPQWLSGFTSGEGSFWIETAKSKTKLGVSVKLIFKLAQHIRDEQLFTSLVEYLGCGKVYLEAVYYRVTKYTDIAEKIIPFFKKYPIVGVKALDFKDFKKGSEVSLAQKNKDHLTPEGLDLINKIKAGMNRRRE